MKFLAAFQKNKYWADLGGPPKEDTAIRAEFAVERKFFKLRTYLQRAGANFAAFGNPGIAGDRLTYDGQLSVFPTSSYVLGLGLNQFKDNLANDPDRTTTTQRVVNMSHSLQLPTATSLSLNASLNTAQGKPVTVLNNQTTTLGLGVAQTLGQHSVSVSAQNSQFRDKNKLAHDLDTMTLGISSSLKLRRNWGVTLGLTTSETKDKDDGSKRSSQSFGPSLSLPLAKDWAAQFWGTYTATKNTSLTLPADTRLLAFNSEYTWACSKQNSVTFGLGGNSSKDKFDSANTYKELTASLRYSYTF